MTTLGHMTSPVGGPTLAQSVEASIALAMERPVWRLSLQAHKVAGLK